MFVKLIISMFMEDCFSAYVLDDIYVHVLTLG